MEKELRGLGDGLVVESDGERGLKDYLQVSGLNTSWPGAGLGGKASVWSGGGGQTQSPYMDKLSLRFP